jgi:pimeloyl-ACP methyl ester carboxylesterase
MESGFVETNGQKLYYEIHGHGYPLLLIQGLSGDADGWTGTQVPAFQEHFKTIVFDNRDVSRSSYAESQYTIADMADDTAGLMEALGIEKAHVLGASMGGMIAQELALRYPEKVDKLLLSCTTSQMARYVVSFADPWEWIVHHDPNGEMLPKYIISMVMTPAFQQNAEAVEGMIQLMLSNPNPQKPEGFSRQAKALVTFDAEDRVGRIKAPTLVMVGDQDFLYPPVVAKALAEAIPGAKLQIVGGGGHCFCWEIPNKFNQVVLDFLLGKIG